MSSIKNWIRLLRVKHWLKNFLVLFPPIFSGQFIHVSELLLGCFSFIAFCFISAAVYILNDMWDINVDRLHPRKCKRPLASGAIGVNAARCAIVVLGCLSMCVTLLYAKNIPESLSILGLYAILNIAYSLGLKKVPILEIAILASGFVLRVLFGGFFCDIAVSSWLFLSVLALSLFMALGKRRGEIARHGVSARKSLQFYTLSFLDKNMYVQMGLGLAFYSLWTVERFDSMAASVNPASIPLLASVPLAMFVCLCYSRDIEDVSSDGDPVEVVMRDKYLLLLVFVWVVDILFAVYFPMLI